MGYIVIHEEFGGQPLAGYLMNVIDLVKDKDGLDVIAFLKKIESFACGIETESDTDAHKLKEFFFGIATEEDMFGLEFYVGYTVAELKNKDNIDGWEYNDVKFYRMYTQDEEWGLDEITLTETETKVQEENTMEYQVIKTTSAECYSKFYDEWFEITKDMGRAEVRIQFLKALYDAEPKGNAKNYVGFVYDDLGDICDESSFKISDDIEDVKEMELQYMNTFNGDTGVHLIQKIKVEEEEFDIVEVTVSRLRVVEERATIKIAIPKDSDKVSAEEYVENNYDEYDDNLDWEEYDDDYEKRDFTVVESECNNWGTREEVEDDVDAFAAD